MFKKASIGIFNAKTESKWHKIPYNGVKCYSASIYDNDVLTRDLVPCLDNDENPCLYDKITGKTFYNKGTGEFIAGAEIE